MNPEITVDISGPSFEDTLAHFGIKGMKWGKRRSDKDPRATDVVSKENKKAAKENLRLAFDEIGPIRMEQFFNPTGMSKSKYDSLSNKDIKIAKGTEFARVSGRKDEKFKDLTYVSRTKEDQELYRGIMPAVQKPLFRRAKASYEYKYENTVALRGPSEKRRVDAFSELMDTPSIPIGSKGKTISGREYLKRAGYGREVKRLDTQQAGMRFYEEMISDGAVNGTPIASAYFKKLSDEGYNMVADDNDRGILSRDPLIILNPNGSLKKMSVRQLSNNDINLAERNFKTALHPKKGG